MKTLLSVACACLLFMVCASSVSGYETDELLVIVRLRTGERSKDSSSKTTTITVEGDSIFSTRSFSGRRRKVHPLRREFVLSPEDKRTLLKVINSNNLLVTDSIELPRNGSNFRYFEIYVDLTLNGKKGLINISGLRTAVEVEAEMLYQNTMTLVKELYRIMNSQDESVYFEELISKNR